VIGPSLVVAGENRRFLAQRGDRSAASARRKMKRADRPAICLIARQVDRQRHRCVEADGWCRTPPTRRGDGRSLRQPGVVATVLLSPAFSIRIDDRRIAAIAL